MPLRLTRPYVGFSPAMPQAAAGERIEPPVSVPIVAGANPAATAAAEPDDEPDGSCARFQGLRAGGAKTSHEGPPWANSHVVFLPRRMPPPALSRAATVASAGGTWFASRRDWPVVRIPAVSTMSFRQYGIPCIGPLSIPAMKSASA